MAYLYIAGIKYKIEFTEGLVDNETMGMCLYDQQKIRVSKELNPGRSVQTLIHEAVHAVLFEAGYHTDKDHDEEFIDRVTAVVTTIFADERNNELVQMMQKGLNE